MSLESIRARVEAVSSSVRETGVIDFEADVAVELCATDIPLLLKVAEAATERITWDGTLCPEFPNRQHANCHSCGVAALCAALAELEAGE